VQAWLKIHIFRETIAMQLCIFPGDVRRSDVLRERRVASAWVNGSSGDDSKQRVFYDLEQE
jgi:hypothetical protein